MFGNNPYARPYQNNINQQSMYEQIDNQINQLQHMKDQMKNNTIQPPAINQTFQLAPTSQGGLQYANSIDEVNKLVIFNDTPIFSKDMSVLWVKKATGDTKAYELKEIIKKDEKDLKIEYLMAQIEELKHGRVEDERTNDVDEPIANTIEDEKSTSVSTISKPNKKSK